MIYLFHVFLSKNFNFAGLSSPHDGVLAKRRKLKQQNSGHSRSVESGMALKLAINQSNYVSTLRRFRNAAKISN
jgi:hypothetical protein